jgi:glutaminyl-peptide cyclotransferase
MRLTFLQEMMISFARHNYALLLCGLAVLVVAGALWWQAAQAPAPKGEKILALISKQVDIGPRHPTASGHAKVQALLQKELVTVTDDVRLQTWQHTAKDGTQYKLANVIGRLYPERTRRIVLGAHYDTKRLASLDKDKAKISRPVPGANDGASGVAVSIETVRVLMQQNALRHSDLGIDVVFFDGEEGEETITDDYDDWTPLGSAYFVQQLSSMYPTNKPELGIVLDMVCEKNLQLLREPNSYKAAPSQVNRFWSLGRERYPHLFGLDAGTAMIDDHTALNKNGIPTFLVIDYEYDAYHTTEDTPDKCTPDNLEAVARTLQAYILTLK